MLLSQLEHVTKERVQRASKRNVLFSVISWLDFAEVEVARSGYLPSREAAW